jgi:NAD(P)-dependent dehydrogenase (short-subunit alcohol dehydrogenase family)
MEFSEQGVVVTGAARGIGEAIAVALHQAGARVVVADLPSDQLHAVAGAMNAQRSGSAWAIEADVSTKAGNETLIDAATERLGFIDLFFANAGVGLGTDMTTPEHEWQLAFAVNVHAHRWAAERLVPEWLAQGRGYFASTASAAGLLSQIGSAPYSVTKHAAVAFAEWLSITYGDQGLRVSCLCPQGVNTAMLSGGSHKADGSGFAAATDVVRAAGRVLEPSDVADAVLEGLRAERFLILPHPEVHDYVVRKAADHDRWIAGMRKLQARVLGA